MTAAGYRVNRRTFFARIGLAGAALAVLPRRGWSTAPADPVTEITSGKVKGCASGGIAGFKGIPYGASTAGTNRFMPPQKPQAWAGLRDAVAWSGHSPQAFFAARRTELTALAPPPDRVPVSEDCQTLNL